MYETDFPCTKCGARLVERLVQSTAHALGSPTLEQSTVAIRADCGVRHSPEAALTALVRGHDVIDGQREVEN